MKKIYAFTLKSYLGPFVLTFFIALFILLMQFLWKYIDDLVGKGLEADVVAQLLFYASATFVPLALPLAILLSSLMTFGNLGEHYELVAMKAAGISIWKIMRPLVYLSIGISMLAFLFSNYVQPFANLKFQSLLYDVRQQKLAFDINEGIFYHGIENYVIRIGEKERDGRTIYDVKIFDHTDRLGNIKVTTAKSGYMELSPDQQYILFTLFDGYSYTDIVTARNYRENRPFDRMAFKQQRIRFDLSEFNLNRTQEELFKSHYTMLNVKQLDFFVDSLELRFEERKDRYKSNFQRRFQNMMTLDTTGKTDNLMQAASQKNIAQKKTDVNNDSTLLLQWPILSNFELKDKNNIVEMAMNATRSTRDNVIFNKNDFSYQQENIRKHELAWHKKFTLSIACLILFFIGAPMGAIIRKGGLGLPVVISVLFFVVYHITSITGEKAAKVGDIDMVLGVWLSSLVLFPIGLFLTFKATTDAALLDVDSWRKIWRKYFGKLKQTKAV